MRTAQEQFLNGTIRTAVAGAVRMVQGIFKNGSIRTTGRNEPQRSFCRSDLNSYQKCIWVLFFVSFKYIILLFLY